LVCFHAETVNLRFQWNVATLSGGIQYMSASHRTLRTRLGVENLETRDTPSATVVDLTLRGSSGDAGGALFFQADPQPTGSGHIASFLRIQGAAAHDEVQQGYNTDARPLQFDENKSPTFTRSLLLSSVPRVTIGGVSYREFLLDINQKSSQPLLSLDELRIYLGTSGNLTGYSAATGQLANLNALYDLDGTGDHQVLLDYRLNSGSGSGDMLLYVPDSLFTGGTFVYLYSKFGESYASNAGFQEWSVGLSSLTNTGGSISGVKFSDNNQNGMRDADEPGLSDWVIYLDTNNNHMLDDGEVYTITDANGHYSFTNLATGAGFSYYVREVQQDGWSQITADPDVIILLPNESRTDVDFGNHQATG
jgi:SdrD B-like domain